MPAPALSPNSVGGEGETSAVYLKTRDWICRTIIRKTRIGQQLFPLLGGEDKR
jgi:hypothetical protein